MRRCLQTLPLVLILSGMTLPCLTACSSMKIALAEQFGYEKREQLVDRVQDARDEQEEAKEQFASALEEFLAVTNAEGSELETMYGRLVDQLDRSEDQADSVRDHIDDVERVADALFAEWTSELDDYTNADLRASSERQLDETRSRYTALLEVMRRAESKMEPVLIAFRDQVLYLKHNLNARAIASLESTAVALQSEIAVLIAEMETSITEANAFIESMGADR